LAGVSKHYCVVIQNTSNFSIARVLKNRGHVFGEHRA
jgi:hypothetical protein